MKFTTTIAIAALSATAAAETCFPGWLCSQVQLEGFPCDNDYCAAYRPYIKQQLYSGAQILYDDGSEAARIVADRKVSTANAIEG